MSNTYKSLTEKWAPVLNEASAGDIGDSYRRSVTAVVLENQEKALQEARSAQQGYLTEDAPGNSTGSIDKWDPILISLVRRAMPNLMAYDIAGVQPMTGPTGLIFAMKARYNDYPSVSVVNKTEAMGINEVESRYSSENQTVTAGPQTTANSDPFNSDYATHTGSGMSTASAEPLFVANESIGSATVTVVEDTVV